MVLSGFVTHSVVFAELDVSAEKSFTFRDYGVRGDLSQFLTDNPLFINDRGFDQSLRIEITGTINDNVYVDVSLDDSIDDKSEEKLLVRVDGRVWDTTLGRVNFNLPDRSYLIHNRTVLGGAIEGRLGKHRVLAFAGRPEGRSERNFFQGKGNQQEYILVDMDGYRNPEVVQGSEVVDIDGRRLSRGADYTMDYEEGTLIISSGNLPVEETSRITISFETLASGSMFQSTIAGVRHEMSLDGTDWTSSPAMNEAGSLKNREYVAWSVMSDFDEKSQEAAEDTSSTPGSLLLFGVDGARTIGGFRVEGEAVQSVYNEDTLYNSTDSVRAIAATGKVSRSYGRNSASFAKTRIEPGFRSIGQETFEKLGSDSDLVGDIDKSTFENKMKLGKQTTVESVVSSSKTNLANDPSLDTSDFSSSNHSVLWKNAAGLVADFKYLKEHTRVDSADTPDNNSESGKERLSSLFEVPAGKIQFSASASAEDNYSAQDTAEDYRSARISLASKAGDAKVSWNTSLQVSEVDVDSVMENARRVSQADVNIGLHALKDVTADFDLKSRLEENFDETDTSRPDRLNTNTGETRVVWKPSDTLTVNFKGSVEQRSRILYEEKSDGDVLDSVEETEETSATLITDNPVLTLYTSDSIEFRPSSKWDHRLGYRQRQEKDAVNGEIFSESLSTDYRLKYAPTRKLRFTSDLVWSDSYSQTANSDRDTKEASGEALYNFREGANLKISSSFVKVDDKILQSEDEETRTQGVSFEREFGRNFVARTGYRYISKEGTVSSSENAFNLGVECTPKKSSLRWQLSLENGDVNGIDTSGNDFVSSNRCLAMSVNGRLGDSGRLEGKLQKISAGADGKGGTGYSATTTEMKVSVDF